MQPFYYRNSISELYDVTEKIQEIIVDRIFQNRRVGLSKSICLTWIFQQKAFHVNLELTDIVYRCVAYNFIGEVSDCVGWSWGLRFHRSISSFNVSSTHYWRKPTSMKPRFGSVSCGIIQLALRIRKIWYSLIRFTIEIQSVKKLVSLPVTVTEYKTI